MTLQEKIQVDNLTDTQKEIVETLFAENLDKKMSSYLSKFEWDDVEWDIWLNVEKNKKWLFNASLIINIDGKKFVYKREDYVKIDDLVNHLFDHFKEELASK